MIDRFILDILEKESLHVSHYIKPRTYHVNKNLSCDTTDYVTNIYYITDNERSSHVR